MSLDLKKYTCPIHAPLESMKGAFISKYSYEMIWELSFDLHVRQTDNGHHNGSIKYVTLAKWPC